MLSVTAFDPTATMRGGVRSGGSAEGGGLSGKTVLIVEDELMIAMEYALHLEALGATVIGPAGTVRQALDLLAKSQIDLAVLDIDLQGVKSFAVADALAARNVGFVFATGYDGVVIPDCFAGVVRCEKPVSPADVADALLKIGNGLQSGADGGV